MTDKDLRSICGESDWYKSIHPLSRLRHSANENIISMSNYSILVVDDEPDNFEVIEGLLHGKDYALHYVSCGQDAIDALDTLNPDLILLDVMMPEMDGLEVCQQIKAIPQWQAIPIIMVTALAEKTDLARCLSMGADDFVCKPVNSTELRARVQSMLRIKKQHDRIESLSKLQRSNIHSLENSLNELRLDLAAGFPTELNIDLKIILDNISLTKKHVKEMNEIEISKALDSIEKSTLKLNKFNQKFLFYLQLNLTVRDPKKDWNCTPKILIEQIVTTQASRFKTPTELILDLEETKIAVAPDHLQYIINELMDNTLNMSKPEVPIHIHGRVVDNLFHFWIDDCEIRTTINRDAILSELIQFDPAFNEHQELDMGLKIAKRIVEMYDGLFLIANTNREYTTIYITLPLATSASPQQSVVDMEQPLLN
jgi:two-component system, sensor histidine kinase and response regulator